MEPQKLMLLSEALEMVKAEATFIEFLKCIETDFENDKEHWQNNDIPAFFECASEWADASLDGLEYYEKPENPWKRCADIIYMGKLYE